MDLDYLLDLPAFEYTPHHPLRTDIAGDMVFYRAWVDLTKPSESLEGSANEEFALIVRDHGYQLDQRSATVATTFITWLGSNNGAHYLNTCEQLKKTSHTRHPYLMAWAAENLRVTGLNSSKRMLELMLEGSTPTAADFELVEHLTVWLGSSKGQEFLQACEAKVRQQRKNVQFEEFLRNNTELNAMQVGTILRLAKDYSPLPLAAPTTTA